MGTPDNLQLGKHAGIEFEIGCQVDKALCHGSTAIPVEVKNRVGSIPAVPPMHELVQVQAQLQLCNTPMGILYERLQHSDGTVSSQHHELWRDDWWWHQELLPALHSFLAVFARLATQQESLELYFRKRAIGQHHRLFQELLWEQASMGWC